MRGTGASKGPWFPSKDCDIHDACAVCKHILVDLYNPPTKLYAIGYSYGCTVAAHLPKAFPQVHAVTHDLCIGLLATRLDESTV